SSPDLRLNGPVQSEELNSPVGPVRCLGLDWSDSWEHWSDADATSLPSGEKVTPETPSEWPSSVRRTAPVAESQSLTVLSSDADATSLPSGEKATPETPFEWPSSVRRTAPVAESQSLTVLSSDADATSLPSGEKATPQTPSEW